MINITEFSELLAELRQRVNAGSDRPIDGVVLAVSEKHLVKKLKDRAGLLLCANYPDADLRGTPDGHTERNHLFLALLEKAPAGGSTDGEEMSRYASVQRVARLLKRELLAMDFVCHRLDGAEEIRTEWEYEVYGGFNGISLGLTLSDHD
ncbi:MAG: hypothetical protein LBN29_11320 [Mediterranea sp.]|jgi:hypothetical protein|nr:hypothetical protein [Mediterranea sp.]